MIEEQEVDEDVREEEGAEEGDESKEKEEEDSKEEESKAVWGRWIISVILFLAFFYFIK